MKSLDQIFNIHGTDKGSNNGDRHNYAPVYSALFSSIRFSHLKMLEIGVFKGASIESWHEFFPNAIIHAVERDPDSSLSRFENNARVKIYYGDATNPSLINETEFKIIIDDAQHTLEQQCQLMQSLWPKLSSGGIYVIEDLFVGELPWGGYACGPKNRAYLRYNSYASGNDASFFPKHPQDINFLNRQGLPIGVLKILDENSHFFTITSIGIDGGLHMMLIINKS